MRFIVHILILHKSSLLLGSTQKCPRRFGNSIAKHKARKIFCPYGACSSDNNIILLPSPEKTCRNRSATHLNDFTVNSVVCLDKRNSTHLTAKIN